MFVLWTKERGRKLAWALLLPDNILTQRAGVIWISYVQPKVGSDDW